MCSCNNGVVFFTVCLVEQKYLFTDSSGPSAPPHPKHSKLELSLSVALDIAEFSKRDSAADYENDQFINHHFSPDLLYKFPTGG